MQSCVHTVKLSFKSSGVSDSIQVQHEQDKDEEMEKVELESDSLLEYMEKVCSDNFISNVSYQWCSYEM